MPISLVVFSWITLAVGVICALWIAFDVAKRPQHMTVMQFVWPICALFGGPVLLWFYLRYGRAMPASAQGQSGHHTHHANTPHAAAVAKSALHCGAGCTLADIIGENLAAAAPAVLKPFGYPGLFSDELYAVWGLDFVLALIIGIAFQYFAIRPMNKDLSAGAALTQAAKADVLSLSSWQIGMYGLMAIAIFAIYEPLFGMRPDVASPVFWMTMQAAMIAGFVTAYPANWLLIKLGIKHAM